MCNKRTYKRFEKIYEFIKKNGKNNTGDIYFYFFNTKLGKRRASISRGKNAIILYYWDKDESMLFSLFVDNKGKLHTANSQIDEPAIFAAIYEIECIINDKKQKERDNLLERLFESIDEYSFMNKFNFTQYR